LLPASVERSADPPAEVPAVVTESALEVGFMVDQEQWSKLDADQRFALTKLVDSGKQNKRKRALIEFLGEGSERKRGL
jgi:Conserved nitrate reductase-associated protein (Nitr_red_assoc)